MQVAKAQAVALFAALDLAGADKWPKAKMEKRLNTIDEIVDEETVVEGDAENALLDQVLEAIGAETPITVSAGGKSTKGKPATKGGKSKGKAGKPKRKPEPEPEPEDDDELDEDEEDEEDEEVETPPKPKRTKGGKGKPKRKPKPKPEPEPEEDDEEDEDDDEEAETPPKATAKQEKAKAACNKAQGAVLKAGRAAKAAQVAYEAKKTKKNRAAKDTAAEELDAAKAALAKAKKALEKAGGAPAKPKAKKAKKSKANAMKGVRPSTTARLYLAGAVIKAYGLDVGITDEMIEALDEAKGSVNPVQSRFDLSGAWHAINAWETADVDGDDDADDDEE